MTYFTLFFTALAAATLLPGGSEALLIYDLSQNYSVFFLFCVVTIGNTCGSVINFYIGKKGGAYVVKNGYVKRGYLFKAYDIFYKYGAFALLISWMPIIGDPITFIAGVLRYELKNFIILVLLAKGIRYAFVIVGYLFFFR